MALPPGWTVTESIENVPNPNAILGPASPYAVNYFARRTFICTDQNGQYVCASGDEGDCEAQAQAMAESWSQQQPYNTAR